MVKMSCRDLLVPRPDPPDTAILYCYAYILWCSLIVAGGRIRYYNDVYTYNMVSTATMVNAVFDDRCTRLYGFRERNGIKI